MSTITSGRVRSQMTHRCLIERNTQTGTDPQGNALAPTWSTHLSDQACKLWQRPDDEIIDGRRTVVAESIRLVLPVATDVTEADRVNGVTDRRGATVLAGVMNIRSVVKKASHLELSLDGAA